MAGGGGTERRKSPPAKQGAVVQDYGAVKVADPYRWLENADDPGTVRWVEAENALTRSYVDGPRREAIKARITTLLDFPRVSVPEKQGARYFFTRNSGLQNQSVLYVREGLEGPERVLLDPNALSADGTVALVGTAPTQDGALLGYSLSRSGSDRQEIYVRDVATGKDLPDKLLAMFSAIVWTPDKTGFYYTRFPEPGSVPAGDENYFAKVYYHRLGESQGKDTLVFGSPDRKEVIWGGSLTHDGRYLILSGNEGSSDKSEVWVADRAGDAKPALLFKGFADAYAYVGDADGRLFFMTDKGAPLWRLVAVDVAHGGRGAAAVPAGGKARLEPESSVYRQTRAARPTVLYGYGGLNVNVTPSFSASRLYWLEQGGIYALANLRGGGEFGEAWHQAGMLDRKQNVFDDFIAAAEWLVKSGYTSRDRLAVQGRSHRGPLVGAVLTQRPDLFGAPVCPGPVADILRYHLFTVGRFWIPEYGSADDPKQFAFLYKYSPYHNVKEGTAYPPTLVTTADTDDRVAPGLAKKFAARLQAATGGEAPILIRVETKAGHGGGKPVSKQIDEIADIYAFLFRALKIE